MFRRICLDLHIGKNVILVTPDQRDEIEEIMKVSHNISELFKRSIQEIP